MKSQYSKKIVYSLILALLLAIVILFLPVWNIEKIQVSGHGYYTSSELIEASGIQKGEHVLGLSKKKIRQTLKEMAYIDEVELKFEFPSTYHIKIKENTPVGYVKFLDTYLCLSRYGKVIDETKMPDLEIPVIKGLKFKSFKMGEILNIENEDSFLLAVEMVGVLKKYEFLHEVDEIDVSNMEQIHLYVNKLDVIIGNIRDFDKKVRWLVEVYKEYPIGVLDLTYIKEGQAILTPLT